ncbi:uncharacterized protein LOC662035 [Tribolium castaneum]|nr:PREDICTED: putative DNA helicase INO80 [Tribolium castaneum]XP_973253.1 PREDICTED: putative DNA helicase INO80 [Tribolium castaneum]|eukprot:XP_008201335.1 PREDICTED: putative DNA helicase INO80 [Tribolium castaneum]
MEASVLHCVNPYDVNPISGTTVVQEESASTGKPIKLEMEEFSDLAPFLPEFSQKTTTSTTDELNTPIFDRKGPFNFMVYENTVIESPQAADPFKFEYDTIRTGNSVLSSKQINDFSVYANTVNVQLQDTNNSEIVNIVQGSEANILFATSESDQGNIYIINGNETPRHVQSEDQISASLFKVEDTTSVISVKSNENQYSNVSSPCNEYSVNTNTSTEGQYSNVSSPSNDYSRTNLGIETPEDSNSSCATQISKKVPKLKLNLSFNQPMVLNTPDVIDSVVDLETSFNILDYVNEKDVTTVNIEDIHFEHPSTSRELTAEIENIAPKLRKRKSKRYDDDEDYVPPSKKAGKREPISSDSESEVEVSLSSKRGRPPRRTSSISSDHSDASKYRELRDKNNEASRKSRLKRKMKEMSLQREAEELYEKNVKLKAQVEEYERMVNNFRNNLFKIMLKK